LRLRAEELRPFLLTTDLVSEGLTLASPSSPTFPAAFCEGLSLAGVDLEFDLVALDFEFDFDLALDFEFDFDLALDFEFDFDLAFDLDFDFADVRRFDPLLELRLRERALEVFVAIKRPLAQLVADLLADLAHLGGELADLEARLADLLGR
jgi:hypothetical protein